MPSIRATATHLGKLWKGLSSQQSGALATAFDGTVLSRKLLLKTGWNRKLARRSCHEQGDEEAFQPHHEMHFDNE